MDRSRQNILESDARVRLITGPPGAGKTHFGCQLAQWELKSTLAGDHRASKILFLTFARNAVARIRQVYIKQSSASGGDPANELQARVRLDTFAGFFWWIVENYGRYIPGGSLLRPWLLGAYAVAGEAVPNGHVGYTYSDLEATALAALRLLPIRKLISEIYPLVIIDEHQDIDHRLHQVVTLLGEASRLVLLRGPNQCIYQQMKGFDPNDILRLTRQALHPQEFVLAPLGGQNQRHCAAISKFLEDFDADKPCGWNGSNTILKLVPRKNTKGNPNELETHVGLALKGMRKAFGSPPAGRNWTIGILVSTNAGAASIYRRLRAGSDAYGLSPVRATLLFDDLLLLQYARLFLELWKDHWIARQRLPVVVVNVAVRLASLFRQAGCNHVPADWRSLARSMVSLVKRQQTPRKDGAASEKLRTDVEAVNKVLRATRAKLPAGCPSTPFAKNDADLLAVLATELLAMGDLGNRADVAAFNLEHVASEIEHSMQQRAVFEKLGLEQNVQVVTIHKSKGREFDGVVVALEDDRRALWRQGSRTSDAELVDLYRVAVSRARQRLCLVAFADAMDVASGSIQRFFPASLRKPLQPQQEPWPSSLFKE